MSNMTNDAIIERAYEVAYQFKDEFYQRAVKWLIKMNDLEALQQFTKNLEIVLQYGIKQTPKRHKIF